MQKYRLLIYYLGTRYAGWQKQRDRLTVQQLLQEAVETVCRQRVSVVGSGRTDSGVHADGQVAHIRLASAQPADALLRALNGVLPWDIRVMRIAPVHAAFHAQKDAHRKRYVYRIFNGAVIAPRDYHTVFHARRRLDWEAMQEASRQVVGRHDFRGLAAASSTVRDFHRTVYRSQLLRKGHHLRYVVEGDGFLHHMVRNIVGTLLQIGWGKRPATDMRRIIEGRDRRLAGPTAKAHGLTLIKVFYNS